MANIYILFIFNSVCAIFINLLLFRHFRSSIVEMGSGGANSASVLLDTLVADNKALESSIAGLESRLRDALVTEKKALESSIAGLESQITNSQDALAAEKEALESSIAGLESRIKNSRDAPKVSGSREPSAFSILKNIKNTKMVTIYDGKRAFNDVDTHTVRIVLPLEAGSPLDIEYRYEFEFEEILSVNAFVIDTRTNNIINVIDSSRIEFFTKDSVRIKSGHILIGPNQAINIIFNCILYKYAM